MWVGYGTVAFQAPEAVGQILWQKTRGKNKVVKETHCSITEGWE